MDDHAQPTASGSEDRDGAKTGPPQEGDDDAVGETKNRQSSSSRTAVREASVQSTGVAVWISADELARLGIDVTTVDAVVIHLEDNQVRLAPAKEKTEHR
jgi:hypothetical protein